MAADGEADAGCVAGVVLGAAEVDVVAGAEKAAEAVGDASGGVLTAPPPQAARTTAIPTIKVRLRMHGLYKWRLRLNCRRLRQACRGE